MSDINRDVKVVSLADAVRSVCAGQPINVAGPAIVLALHALLIDTGAPPQQLTLAAEELMRRLTSMINAPHPS